MQVEEKESVHPQALGQMLFGNAGLLLSPRIAQESPFHLIVFWILHEEGRFMIWG